MKGIHVWTIIHFKYSNITSSSENVPGLLHNKVYIYNFLNMLPRHKAMLVHVSRSLDVKSPPQRRDDLIYQIHEDISSELRPCCISSEIPIQRTWHSSIYTLHHETFDLFHLITGSDIVEPGLIKDVTKAIPDPLLHILNLSPNKGIVLDKLYKSLKLCQYTRKEERW